MSEGPLHGYKVLEVEGIGAAPFGSMLLADFGADVLRIERLAPNVASVGGTDPGPVTGRGRSGTIRLDLKTEADLQVLLRLSAHADVLVESFRPGVAERLGFGPDVALATNPRLVYGRLTGWGREGRLAPRAGHDINYIGVAGLLGQIGRKDSPPAPPLAIGADIGGGGMLLALGILAALLERERSGHGQVVDAAMVRGAALMMSSFWGNYAKGNWVAERESNYTDGGAPFYDTYQCSDGLYMAVGALEYKFFKTLCETLGINSDAERQNRDNWPDLRLELKHIFKTQPQSYWVELFENTDACVSPVLNFATAPSFRNAAPGGFLEQEGVIQPSAAPEFSRTPARARPRRLSPDFEALSDWGLDPRTAGHLLKHD